MRTIFMGKRELLEHPVHYYLLIDGAMNQGMNFGVRVEASEEIESICDITISQRRIFSLIARLMDGAVTPTTVHDVVEDWLAF